MRVCKSCVFYCFDWSDWSIIISIEAGKLVERVTSINVVSVVWVRSSVLKHFVIQALNHRFFAKSSISFCLPESGAFVKFKIAVPIGSSAELSLKDEIVLMHATPRANCLYTRNRPTSILLVLTSIALPV